MFLFDSDDKIKKNNENEYLNTLKQSIKFNHLDAYILGVMGPEIAFMGEKYFDYNLCLRTIYYYYTEIGDTSIYDKLINAIDSNANSKSLKSLYSLIYFCKSVEDFQINNIAPFKIDLKNVYLKIKANLENNKEFFTTSENDYYDIVEKNIKELL